MEPRNSILERIETFDFDDHDEETLKRLCREVPCTVNVSHCNVVKWFESQVEQKMEKSDKWKIYLDNNHREQFLLRKGAFLYEKYLEGIVDGLRKSNQKRLRKEVWFGFRRRDREKLANCELSIETIFNDPSLCDTDRSLESISQTSSAVPVPNSFPFECDLDHIITSTQQSEYEDEE